MNRPIMWASLFVLLALLACGAPDNAAVQSAAETMVAQTAAAQPEEPSAEPTTNQPEATDSAVATEEATDPPAPSEQGSSRSAPASIGDPITFAELGTVTVTTSDWVPGQAGRVILSLTLNCEVPADDSCNTVQLIYNAVGGSATVYDQVFDTLVPDPTFYLQEVFGGGTITGSMAFDVEAEDELVLRIKPVIDLANQDRYIDLTPGG